MMKKAAPLLSVVVLAQLFASCAKDTGPSVTTEVKKSSRTPDSEQGDTPWTTWSKKGTVGGLLVLKHIRETLLKENLHDPHVDYKGHEPIDCSKQNTRFRSADGSCTDIENPHVGASGTAFGRNVPPEFIAADAKEMLMTPNPAVVSETFFTRDEFKPVPFLNMLAVSWIQFMNHDWLSHGKNAERNPHRVQTKNGVVEVERTQDNHVDKNQYKKEYGKVSLNEVTHWWDGSQIYGSNQKEQDQVRSFAKGKMLTVTKDGRELLPKDSDLNSRDNKLNRGYEVTGFRDNWWVGLSMLHTLFVKEHNAIADMLYEKHVRFDEESKKFVWNQNGFIGNLRNRITRGDKNIQYFTEKELDEHVFQTARLINAAVMAKIHTVEWTPAILDNFTLRKGMYSNWYGMANPITWIPLIKNVPGFARTEWFKGNHAGYMLAGIVGQKTDNYGVPFSITEEFTSVYRLHSLLPEQLDIRKLSKKTHAVHVPLAETRNEKSYAMMEKNDLKDLFYSFGTQKPGQLVLNNFPKFMQELTIPGHGKMDLAMVDVMRDRERGVPRYNQFRRAIGLRPIARYQDFFRDDEPMDDRKKAIIKKFVDVYGKDAEGNDNVELIDLLVGTSAEEVRPEGFGFGETMFQIFIVMASRRLMADRFYTDNYRKEYYTAAGMKWIDHEGFMHKVIERHMPELKPHMQGLRTAFNPWNN